MDDTGARISQDGIAACTPSDGTERLLLTPYQNDIWVAARQFPGLDQYTIFIHDRYVGTIDISLLGDALARTARRTDAFNLRLGEEDGIAFQWRADTPDLTVQHIDLRHEADSEGAAQAWIGNAFDFTYDLESGDLVDLAILRTSEAVYVYVRTHHIFSDAWGLQLFMTQVRAAYLRAANLRNSGDPVAEAPSPAFPPVASAEPYISSDRHRSDRAFFETHLDGVEPALFARKRANGARATARHTLMLERSVLSAIRQRGHSPFLLLSAAVALYLGRVHQTGKVVLGIPTLNRGDLAAKRTVGHFANTLPLHVAIDENLPAAEFLDTLRENTRALLRHQRLPLGELMRGRGPLFDTTISYMRWPDVQSIGGVSFETCAGTHAHDPDALAIWVSEFDGTRDVRVDFEYACDVFDADFPITSAVRHIETLFRAFIDGQDGAVGSFDPLSAAERNHLTFGLNATGADFPQDATLPDLFAAQVIRTPDAVALIEPDGSTTSFAELAARAQGVASALRAKGVSPDDRVAVLVERGRHMLPAILGIQLAGAAYVPISPTYPAERIQLLLRDCGARIALAGDLSGELAENFAESAAGVRFLNIADLPQSCDQPILPAATATDLAYVIYTSGSTGRPKGVMVEHRSVVNRLWWMQRRYAIGEGDVLLQKTPILFDVSVWELFWWSFTGARLSLLAPGAEKDPRALIETIERDAVTVIHFVPSMLSPLLDFLESDPDARRAAASLRRVFCSGEALAPAQVARFHRIFAGAVSLVNLYGPTEATVDVSFFDCLPGDPPLVPIGRPIDNISLHVLDRSLRPQPPGVPGELHIGGVGVARGYLDRPELTAERFVADPFEPGGRLYRTGDLARWLADGTLEYLGRADDQVKIRGNRVEPGEVRDHVTALPGIREAVVLARRSETRGTHLVAYYIAEAKLDAAELRRQLAQVLPDFMIPAFFVRIDAVPLTPNGKLDHRKLPQPDGAAIPLLPRTPVETELCAIWADVLGVNTVGVLDEFYALGGDSILMLRVRANAQRRGLSFELADLIRNPTVAGLAPYVARVADAAVERPIEPFAMVSEVDKPRLADLEDAFPVSRLSLGLLFHANQHPGSSIYHDVFRYRFDLSWDEPRFRRAVGEVVARFPALRSSFDLTGFSEPLQLVHKSVDAEPLVRDLRGHDDPHGAIADHVRERRFQRYDMERPGAFLFAAFVRDDGVDLVFSFHHAILDGWSVASLIVALTNAYKTSAHTINAHGGERQRFDPPPLASYVREERRALASPAARRYWNGLLDGAAMTRLDGFGPHEIKGCGDDGEDGDGRRVELPDILMAKVKSAANARAMPLKSVLLAAHCLALHLFCGSDTVVTGVVTHGRPDLSDADRMVGLFLNTMPVRSQIAGRNWFGVVGDLFRQERDGHPHRRYPLSAIKEARGEAVLTAFNYVNLHVLEGLRELRDFQVWEETNFAPLVNVIVDPAGSGTYVRVDRGGGAISAGQADLIGSTYVEILRRMVDEPDAPVDFAFLATRQAIAPRPQPLLCDVVTRFVDQAAETPEACAVALDECRWTYADLDRMSRSVAARLVAAGAGPGETIGIALERSVDMIAAILGTLRAGLVCLPLDVSYPAARLALIMDKARPFRVIAHPQHEEIAPPNIVMPVADLLSGVDASDPAFADLPLEGRTLDDPALILFTSGSTGEPKGVEITHRTFANFVQWQLRVPSGMPGARTLQFAPLGFDVAFGEIFSTLCAGGELRLIRDGDRLDTSALLRLIDRYDVERVLLPFVAFQRMAETSNALGVRPGALRVIITSGEQLRFTSQVRAFCAAMPGLLVENQYGPTEAYVVSSHALTGDPTEFPDLPPIGRPIDGVEMQVLDAGMRPVPTGVTGEIYLGGDCLARGYHRAPDLTAQRFLPHPFRPGATLYRTGDLGRLLVGGEIVWLGRADDQVKVRGFRIEPAEVELAVMRQGERNPGLRAAAVVARSRDGEDSFLAAFLVGERDGIDLDGIQRALRAELPEYMVPARFVCLDAFPLTVSGKRDDAALRALAIDPVVSFEHVAPRNDHERTLCGLLAELLDASNVGVRDDFFALGGTSLTAMRFVVTIEKLYGVAVPIAALIENPTVEGLAEHLDAGSARREFDPLVPLRKTGDRPPLFIVHPLGGNVPCYLPLTRALPLDQPVYALQAAGSEKGSTPLETIEAMAQSYLTAIRRVQPQGPYMLAGWSFGGFVAYEMARQLRAAEPDVVAHVIVLDSIAMPRDRDVHVGEAALLEFFYCELVWFERSLEEVELLPANLSAEEKLDHIVERAISAGVLPAGASRATVRRLYALFRASWGALIAYRPEVADADVSLLRASGPLPASLKPMHHAAGTFYDDPRNGWHHWTTGKLEVIDVPGDHLDLMKPPHVETIASTIMTLVEPFHSRHGVAR